MGLQPYENATDQPSTGYVTAYWAVDDVNAIFNELLALGATTLEEPFDVGGGIVLAAVKDPWGNAFGIINNPHFDLSKTN